NSRSDYPPVQSKVAITTITARRCVPLVHHCPPLRRATTPASLTSRREATRRHVAPNPLPVQHKAVFLGADEVPSHYVAPRVDVIQAGLSGAREIDRRKLAMAQQIAVTKIIGGPVSSRDVAPWVNRKGVGQGSTGKLDCRELPVTQQIATCFT